MGKEEIKSLIENSKKAVKQDHEKFSQSIKDDLQSFKKKTLEKI